MISRLLKPDCTEVVYTSQKKSASKAIINWLVTTYFCGFLLLFPPPQPASLSKYLLTVIFHFAFFFFFLLILFALSLSQAFTGFYCDDGSRIHFLSLDFIFSHCFLTHYPNHQFNHQNSSFKNWGFYYYFSFPTMLHFLLPWSTHAKRQSFGLSLRITTANCC